ncbi:MAG: hypothetical protein LLG04_04100 [Parachlamydia sp.]|nr:hypothetical protein [Parachlamydia sp.]
MINFRSSGIEGQNPPVELHKKTATSRTADTLQTRQISKIFKEQLSFIAAFVERTKENEGCENHVIGMRHTADKINHVAKRFFRKLADLAKHAAAQIADTRVVRKLKDMLDYLNSCDFKFVRHSEDPVLKDARQQKIAQLLKQYQEYEKISATQTPEEAIETTIGLLVSLGALEFEASEYPIRNAMTAEILTKHLAPLPLKMGLRIPCPCFTAENKPIVATYQIHDILPLSSTQIPVYILTPEDKKLPPLLIFRGTVLNLSRAADAASIIENMNKIGPARKPYDEFKATLGPYLQKMAKEYPPFRFLGYSQGGVLAARACVDFPGFLQKQELNGSILFNPPGLEADYCARWDILSETERPMAVTYLVTRDIVSKRGHKFIGSIYEIQPPANAILHSHLGAKFLNPNWNLFAIDNEKEAQSPTRKLVNQLMACGLVQGLYTFASRQMEKIQAHAQHRVRTIP